MFYSLIYERIIQMNLEFIDIVQILFYLQKSSLIQALAHTNILVMLYHQYIFEFK